MDGTVKKWLKTFLNYFNPRDDDLDEVEDREDDMDNHSVDQVVSDQEYLTITPIPALFQDLNQTPSPVQPKDRYIEVNDQRAVNAQNNIIKKSLNPKRKNSQRLGSVAKKRKQKQERADSAIWEEMKGKYFKEAKEKGYTSNVEDYFSLAKAIAENEKYVHQSNQEELARNPERVVIVSNNEWLESLRASIRNVISRAPEKLEIIEDVQTKKYDQLLKKKSKQQEIIEKIIDEETKPKKIIHSEEELFPPLSKEDLDRVNQAWSGSGIVVSAFNVDLKSHDLKTLKGREWLNDEFDLSTLDLLIFPVHMGNHWCCAAINFIRKRFEYYDSLHGDNLKCLRLMREYLMEEYRARKNAEYSLDGWIDYAPKDCPAQNNGYDCGVFACMAMDFSARQMEFVFNQKHMPYLRKRIAKEILDKELIYK